MPMINNKWEETEEDRNPLQTQVAGDHYKKYKIQPVEFLQANEFNHIESAIIKYACRHRDKNGKEDLLKIKHYVDVLIELEYPDA